MLEASSSVVRAVHQKREKHEASAVYHSRANQANPGTLGAIGAWAMSLFQLHQRLGPYFARPQVRAHALLYLQAILSEIPRKNSWQIAEYARQARHLLARLLFPAPTSAPLLCHWSWWRRTHQYWAGYYHRRRRDKAG